MTVIYVTPNLLNANTLSSVSSEDSVYTKDNLYNQRPSKVFRFTAKTGNTVTVNLGSAIPITTVAVINHNFTASVTLNIQGNASDSWGSPSYAHSLTYFAGINNLYFLLNQTYQYWRLTVDDSTNTVNPQIGQFIIGNYASFGSGFHLVGKSEGPKFWTGSQITPYGQPWDVYLSEQMTFELNVTEVTSKGSIDAIRAFLESIGGPAGRFLIVPDNSYSACYYVKPSTDTFLAPYIIGNANDIYEWTMPLIEFPRGIELL